MRFEPTIWLAENTATTSTILSSNDGVVNPFKKKYTPLVHENSLNNVTHEQESKQL